MGWLQNLFGATTKAAASEASPELIAAMGELRAAHGPRAQQMVFERHAALLFQDHALRAGGDRKLRELISGVREHGIAVFGPVETDVTRSYPGQGPGVTMAEQLGLPPNSPEAIVDSMVVAGYGDAVMLPFHEQMKRAVIDLAMYWEAGHLKDAIRPGLGNIGPFMRKRAYLTLTDPMLHLFESIAGDNDEHARTAASLSKLITECRRDGMDAALRNNPQPSGTSTAQPSGTSRSQPSASSGQPSANFVARIRAMQSEATGLANSGRHDEGLAILEKAENACREAKHDPALAMILHEKAITVSTGERADPSHALEILEEAEQLCNVLGMWSELYRVLQSKSIWYRKLGDDEKASRYWNESKEVRSRHL